MSYSKKQSKPASDSTQHSANIATASAFSDQRAAANIQLRQQKIMHAFDSENAIQKTIQRKTKIEHQTTDFTYAPSKTDKVGVAMRAWLDPHDAVQGSETGTPQKALYDAVNSRASASMVRGHLLNHDLGGYGVAENLYPITSAANSKHKLYVENPVQEKLSEALKTTGKSQHDNNTGQGIYYQVNVGNLQTDTDNLVTKKVEFICTAKTLNKVGTSSIGEDGTTLFNTTIVSDTQGAKSGDRGIAHKTGDTNAFPDMKVTKKIIPTGWDHGGRSGTQDFTDKVNKSIFLINANTATTTLTGATSKSQAVESAKMEAHAIIQEANTAINEANNFIQLKIYEGVSLEVINQNPIIAEISILALKLGEDIKKMLSTTFSTEDQLVSKIKEIEEVAEYIIDLAWLVEREKF